MMERFPDLDDLRGDEPLAALVDELRSYARGPAPAARPDLLRVLTEGLTGRPGPTASPVPVPVATPPRRRLGERLQTRRARLVLGAAVASVGLLSTGAAGALPGPAQSALERAASAVGIELPGAASDGGPGPGSPQQPPGAQNDAGASGSEPGSPPPVPSLDRPAEDGTSPGRVPPADAGEDEQPGASPGRSARDDGLARRPLPSPAAPGRPDLGGGRPGPEVPGPAAPGTPGLPGPGRPDGVPGLADDDADEQDDDVPGRPGPPAGELPGNAGDGPNAPAGTGQAAPPR